MAFGIADISALDTQARPSASVWGDCPTTDLPGRGLGYFFHQDFIGDYPTSPGISTVSGGTSVYGVGATATYGPNVLSVATGGTDNNSTLLSGNAFGKIARFGGVKYWAEIRVAVGALNDSAFAFGLTTQANLVVGLIANDPSNSAVAALAAATFIGFVSVQATSALATVNIVNQKGAATAVTVATNVTNSTALPLGNRANLVANTFVKLGIRFDGQKTLYFYVNGVRVARAEVDGTYDQATDLAPVFAQKTGTAAATTNYLDFFRAGCQFRA